LWGLQSFFFFKADEQEDSDIFLASETSSDIIDLLKGGRLSIFGALRKDRVSFFELTRGLNIVTCVECNFHDVPEDLLPTKSTPLFSHFGPATDNVEQALSFFSVRFEGKRLSSSGMPFSLFKGLIDHTYDVARKLLSPETLAGVRSNYFDFPIHKPAFSSLIVAMGEPTLNVKNISEKLGDNVVEAELRAEFEAQKDRLFNDMNKLIGLTERGRLNTGMVTDNFVMLDNLKPLIPTEKNELVSVEFASRKKGGIERFHISEKAGDALEKAIKIAEMTEVTDAGKIQVINAASRTFVIWSDRDKQVTCNISDKDFSLLTSNPEFRTGSRASVRGVLRRRKQCDQLFANQAPVIS
jgi:hypothetical protein